VVVLSVFVIVFVIRRLVSAACMLIVSAAVLKCTYMLRECHLLNNTEDYLLRYTVILCEGLTVDDLDKFWFSFSATSSMHSVIQ